jgi:hypothetical protein
MKQVDSSVTTDEGPTAFIVRVSRWFYDRAAGVCAWADCEA